MTDERLDTIVAEWLKDTDTPSRDAHSAVAASVRRAGGTSQVGRWLPSVGLAGRPAFVLASIVAVLLGVQVGTGLLSGRTATSGGDHQPGVGAAPITDDALDDYRVVFAADSMILEVDDGGSYDLGSLNADIGRHPSGVWSMDPDWPVDELAVWAWFDSDGVEWWLDRIEIRPGLVGVSLEARQPFNRLPLRDWLEGDVALELVSPVTKAGAEQVRAQLRLGGSRMTMEPDPGSIGYTGDDFAWYMGQLGELARSLAFWDRPPEPQRRPAADERSPSQRARADDD